jgi:hypothetical protein
MAANFNPIIEEQLQNLESKTKDELLDVVGAYALSEKPEELESSLAFNKVLDANKIRDAGLQFLKDLEPVIKDAICGPDGILDNIEKPTVKDIMLMLFPALGFSLETVVPIAIIALCIIIARSGVREYCKGLQEE